MRVCTIVVMAVIVVLLCGCGGGDGIEGQGQPIVSDIELTPAGTRDFVLVGETGIFFNTSPAAVDTPTLIRITRFPSTVGLVAPMPQGFGFVAAAELERVTAPSEMVIAAPVILRIPPSRSLPEGRRLLVMVADGSDRQPVFRPLVDNLGQTVNSTIGADGRAQFQTTRLGSFLLAEESNK